MGIFGNNRNLAFKEGVKNSFSKVKEDTQKIFQWVQYFYQQGAKQEQMVAELTRKIEHLEMQLSYMPKSKEEIREVLDNHYPLRDVIRRVDEIKVGLERAPQSMDPVLRRLEGMEVRMREFEQARPSSKESLKEKIFRRIRRNSRDYVQNLILSMIRKYEKISALQLREMIVEEQGLCSKSSFYRILEKVESMDEVGIIEEGREKVFLSKATNSVENR